MGANGFDGRMWVSVGEDNAHEPGKAGYKGELHDVFDGWIAEDVNYEVDFDIVVEGIVCADDNIPYEQKVFLLRNLGYLLDNGSPSLSWKDLVVVDNIPIREQILAVWRVGIDDEYELDALFSAVHGILGV
jgi:hypothetical protein